jgi:hypothetical protein
MGADGRKTQQRYLARSSDGGARMRHYDEPLVERVEIADGCSRYRVVGVEESETAGGFGQTWVEIALYRTRHRVVARGQPSGYWRSGPVVSDLRLPVTPLPVALAVAHGRLARRPAARLEDRRVRTDTGLPGGRAHEVVAIGEPDRSIVRASTTSHNCPKFERAPTQDQRGFAAAAEPAPRAQPRSRAAVAGASSRGSIASVAHLQATAAVEFAAADRDGVLFTIARTARLRTAVTEVWRCSARRGWWPSLPSVTSALAQKAGAPGAAPGAPAWERTLRITDRGSGQRPEPITEGKDQDLG